MTSPQQTQPPQQPPAATVEPPQSADANVIVPVLLTIFAAYVGYRLTKGVVKGPWRVIAAELGLLDMAGNALGMVAQRALNRQRVEAGRSGDALWEWNDKATKLGVEAGIQTIAAMLRNMENPNPVPIDPGVKPSPDRARGRGLEVVTPTPSTTIPQQPDVATIRRLADNVADSTGYAAQQTAAESAGWMKRWNSRHDLRVRSSHAFLNGITVSASEPFVTEDGARIRFPHDPLAPIGEVVNCRCSMDTYRPALR